MYCRRCTYPLRDLPAGACPECGGRFDPADPSTYAPRPPWLTARRKRRLVIASVTVAVVAAALILLPPPYARLSQYDLNSGRERVVHLVFGQAAFATAETSDFAAFAAQHLRPLGPPAWRSYHYSSPFGSARINFGSYDPLDRRRSLIRIFEWAGWRGAAVPLHEQIRLAETVLQLTAMGPDCSIEVTSEGGIEVWDADGRVVVGWHPPPKPQSAK